MIISLVLSRISRVTTHNHSNVLCRIYCSCIGWQRKTDGVSTCTKALIRTPIWNSLCSKNDSSTRVRVVASNTLSRNSLENCDSISFEQYMKAYIYIPVPAAARAPYRYLKVIIFSVEVQRDRTIINQMEK